MKPRRFTTLKNIATAWFTVSLACLLLNSPDISFASTMKTPRQQVTSNQNWKVFVTINREQKSLSFIFTGPIAGLPFEPTPRADMMSEVYQQILTPTAVSVGDQRCKWGQATGHVSHKSIHIAAKLHCLLWQGDLRWVASFLSKMTASTTITASVIDSLLSARYKLDATHSALVHPFRRQLTAKSQIEKVRPMLIEEAFLWLGLNSRFASAQLAALVLMVFSIYLILNQRLYFRNHRLLIEKRKSKTRIILGFVSLFLSCYLWILS